MKKIIYISEFTQEQFSTKKEYDEHIKNYKIQVERLAEQKKNFEALLNIRFSIDDINTFPDKIFQSIKTLCPETNLLKIHFTDLHFGNISNSHSAPLGFEQNFTRKPDKPLSYPGWHGAVTFVYSNSNRIGDNWLNRLDGLNTGSGGYRGSSFMEYNNVYVLSYELRLYVYDFPILNKQYDRYLELKELNKRNDEYISILHKNTLKLSKEYQNTLKNIVKIQLKIDKLYELLNAEKNKRNDIDANTYRESESKCSFVHSDEFNELANKFDI